MSCEGKSMDVCFLCKLTSRNCWQTRMSQENIARSTRLLKILLLSEKTWQFSGMDFQLCLLILGMCTERHRKAPFCGSARFLDHSQLKGTNSCGLFSRNSKQTWVRRQNSRANEQCDTPAVWMWTLLNRWCSCVWKRLRKPAGLTVNVLEKPVHALEVCCSETLIRPQPSCCVWAKRGEVGTALWSHVCAIVGTPTTHTPLTDPPGLALHCHMMVSHDLVMDGRRRSAFSLTKHTCH